MAQRTRVSFELERLALEGDELIISGFWTGVRGMRFVRPTLLADDRRILATLEHKPWAPSENTLWTAAFPWTGGIAVDADSLSIAVAPKVIVPLGETATGAPAPAEPAPSPDSARAQQPAVVDKPAPVAKAAAAAKPAKPAKPAAKPAAAPVAKPAATPVAKPAAAPVAKPAGAPVAKPAGAPVAKPAAAPVAKPAPAPKPAPVAQAVPVTTPSTPAAKRAAVANPARVATPAEASADLASNGASASRSPVVPVDPRADELARALAAAEGERDRALAQLAEAVKSRDAAVRTRARMELAHDEALEARKLAESALARAVSERQEAVVQRDEVLVACRTLQRQLQTERAQADRVLRGEPDADPDADEPLGVRKVPAVRSVMAELQYPPRPPKRRLAKFDLWVVRVVGLAAAGCFLLLLISILRVFN